MRDNLSYLICICERRIILEEINHICTYHRATLLLSLWYFIFELGVRLQFIVRRTIIPGGILTSIQYRDGTDIVNDDPINTFNVRNLIKK